MISHSIYAFKFNSVWLEHSVQFSHSVMSDSLRPHESQHTRPPCPSPTPGVHSNSCSSSQWCHPAISSSVISFSSCPQSFSASESFPMSQLFAWGGQSIRVSASASVLPTWSIWWQLPYLAFQLHLQTYPIESLKAERPFENSQMINSRVFFPSPFPRELVVKANETLMYRTVLWTL